METSVGNGREKDGVPRAIMVCDSANCRHRVGMCLSQPHSLSVEPVATHFPAGKLQYLHPASSENSIGVSHLAFGVEREQYTERRGKTTHVACAIRPFQGRICS